MPSRGVTAYFGRTSELPPPPVRATAALGPITATERVFAASRGSRPPSFFSSTMLSVARRARHGPLLGRVHFAAADVRLVEQPGREHHAQDAAHAVVHGALLHLARCDRGQHLLLGEPARAVACLLRGRPGEPVAHRLAAGHLQVHAGVDRPARCCTCCPSRR